MRTDAMFILKSMHIFMMTYSSAAAVPAGTAAGLLLAVHSHVDPAIVYRARRCIVTICSRQLWCCTYAHGLHPTWYTTC